LGLVGKTEQGLLQDGISYKKSVAKKLGWPTYRRVGLNHAGYKILTDDNGRFLGAHFLSDNACGILNTIRLAMMNGITVDQLYRQSITGPYPSRESDLIYMLKPLLSGSSEA
jgi:glutathione reductase (NADPH)